MSVLKPDWDLAQWLNVLENRHKTEIQLGLARITEVAARMNLLQPQAKVITVGGTNGKGSTVTALEHLYFAAGYKVAAYTSPHLLRYNERIRVQLEQISDDSLCQAFHLIEQARVDTLLTYFETTTLAALWYFQQQQVDLIILEVGLGGRLDCTNIIDSDLAIITTVDFDHQELLGDTLEAIGYEKAGIMRAHKPCIYADSNPPPSVLEQARLLQSPCYLYGKEYSFQELGNGWELLTDTIRISQLPRPTIQLKSAAAAVFASQLLQPQLPVDLSHIQLALQHLFIPGRLQHVSGVVDVLYDVSHNPQSARLLADYLTKLPLTGKIHAVFSALKDKDILNLITPLRDCVDHWYPAQLDYKRAASDELLLAAFAEAEILAKVCYYDPLVAFETALRNAEQGDLIVVFGSFFTVSYVMSARLKEGT